MRRRKVGAGSMATTSCRSSFKVSHSPMGSKSRSIRHPLGPKPPPPEPCGRHQNSAIALSSGAPPSTHLRTKFTGGLSGKDSGFKHILAAFDANAVVVHLDHLDERLQVGLSKWHRSSG